MPNPDFQVAPGTDNGTIALSGRLDFATAKSALSMVNEQIQSHPEASIIDLGGVTHSNSAALALMIEWLAEARRNNRQIQFTNIPDSLRQISTVCQVDSLI